MATETSSIDEMLLGGGTPSTPATPESSYEEPEIKQDEPESSYEEPEDSEDLGETEDDETPESKKKEPEHDDYGNPKDKPRTYTEDEVNERINKAIRERLARGNHNNQQPTPQQVATQAQDFEYNPDSAESWQTQLEKFVETTVSRMGARQAEIQQRQQDEQHHAEFVDKFERGMSRFADFREVVSSQPVTDPMTYALRGLSDPAAFIYAASKRHPQELSRISQLPDPYAQMVEMGKLEERMRKAAPGTKAPKPVSRSLDDGTMPAQSKKKEASIEDLIAKSDAKRRAQLENKRRR